jgi:hypothetical protein
LFSELNVIAERVAQGSMKQLREQVVLDFKHINRKFRERFRNATLLHLICQQGYYDMLEFVSSRGLMLGRMLSGLVSASHPCVSICLSV